jgi:hypothetical protein
LAMWVWAHAAAASEVGPSPYDVGTVVRGMGGDWLGKC